MRGVVELQRVQPAGKWHRLVPSHFPPIDLFEGLYDSAEEMAVVIALESLSNPRLENSIGRLHDLPASEWVYGAGATPLMAAFTHYGKPSRFTDGSFGVYYAANTLHTAIAEVSYHLCQFYAATREGDAEITVREYVNAVAKPVLDVRQMPDLHLPDDYQPAQAFAYQQRANSEQGLLYRSVRQSDGLCVVAFLPKALTIPRQGKHIRLIWNGLSQSIVGRFSMTAV